MAAILVCGFECGTSTVVAGNNGGHWATNAGSPAFSTTIHRAVGSRGGLRSLRCNAAGSSVVMALQQVALPLNTTSLRHVGRVYIYFASLPSGDVSLYSLGSLTGAPTNQCNVRFKQSDGKLYAAVGTTLGATGVSVTTGTWYRVNFDFAINTGGNDTADVSVDGTACGQATAAGLSAAIAAHSIGVIGAVTADVHFDDVKLSFTGADHPIAAGYSEPYVPVSDGTHNVAGANDFERTLTGTDIINSTTDAYLLLKKEPMDTNTSVFINMVAPPNATDYTEHVLGPMTGISAPSAAPTCIDVLMQYAASGTGLGNIEGRLNDNGTTAVVFSQTGVAGQTSSLWGHAAFATAPAGGGAWVIGGGGNGDFTDLRVQCGSPAALDVNPDQYFVAFLVEADFPDAGGPTLASLVATQATTTAQARTVGAVRLAAAGATATQARAATSTRTAAQAASAAALKTAAYARALSQGTTALNAALKLFTKALVATQAAAGTAARTVGATRIAAQAAAALLAPAARLVRLAGQAQTAATAAATTGLSRTFIAPQAQAATLSAVRAFLKTQAAAQAQAASLARQAAAARTAAQAQAARLARTAGALRTAAQAATAIRLSAAARTLAPAAQATAATISSLKVFLRQLASASQPTSAALARRAGSVRTAAQAQAAILARAAGKIVRAGQGQPAILARAAGIMRAAAQGATARSAAALSGVSRTLIATQAAAVTQARQARLALAASAAAAASVGKLITQVARRVSQAVVAAITAALGGAPGIPSPPLPADIDALPALLACDIDAAPALLAADTSAPTAWLPAGGPAAAPAYYPAGVDAI